MDHPPGDDNLLEYRVGRLEAAVESISETTAELRDFAVTVRAWIKVAAVAWSLIAGCSMILLAWALAGGVRVHGQ
jgi:hypothetical protein